jgi:hypothetical protein
MSAAPQVTTDLAPWQMAALHNPAAHFAFFGGVGTGKTFTGAQWAVLHILSMPHLTGFIGANTYDQLSQATLRELFYWLDAYGIEYVIDRKPPPEWGAKKTFKKYTNILSCKVGTRVAHVFCRVLSKGNPLRGLEFSWYWLDETRDTPRNTHDVVLSRMRESNYARGLITTTTNGEDWSYERFVKGNDGSGTYGSMHVPTEESVRAGILTEEFYRTLLKSYSNLMADQELRALHVNTRGGRAYYAESAANRKRRAPWGDAFPDVNRTLYVGCDFNFAPAPLVWTIFQLSPEPDEDGEYDVHVFANLHGEQQSTEEMTRRLASLYGDFFIHIFGDSSGNVGTTSNAGETDYAQMADVLSELDVAFTIDTDAHNPVVKDRVENVNRLLCDGTGRVRLTYDPDRAPLLALDFGIVGWSTSPNGKGKLTGHGNPNATHSSDGLGYGLFKLFPPGRRSTFGVSVPSARMSEVRSAL